MRVPVCSQKNGWNHILLLNDQILQRKIRPIGKTLPKWRDFIEFLPKETLPTLAMFLVSSCHLAEETYQAFQKRI